MKPKSYMIPKKPGNVFSPEFMNQILFRLQEINECSDFSGDATYRFSVEEDGNVYLTPILRGKKKGSFYEWLDKHWGYVSGEEEGKPIIPAYMWGQYSLDGQKAAKVLRGEITTSELAEIFPERTKLKT